MSKNFYTWILKGGVLASFIIPFFVFNNMLFPYITSKQLPFNLLIEVLAVFWVALVVKYPDFRPKKNFITLGLVGFFVALTLSALLGVDFAMSFWSNVERMLGVFHLYHFLMLFLIIITVFRTEFDWQLLIHALVLTAGFEAIYAVSMYPGTNYGHLGNSSYTSGQMIFALFFAAYLFYKNSNILARAGYAFLSIFMFIAFVNAGTRGAQVGLFAGIVLIAFIMAMFSKRKEVKIASFGVIALLAIGLTLIMTNAQAGWVTGNKFFSRITQINFQTATFQTRLLSWNAAFKDFPHHPFFGTGYGNYAISFDKYLDPKFFTYENTYFDHAHNNLVDLLSTTGLVGLLAYLSIFVAVVFYLYKAFKKGNLSNFDFALFFGLLAAYFIQNIVLFDSFITYLALMVFFGLIYYSFHKNELAVNNPDTGTSNQEYATWIAVGLLVMAIAWNYNIRPWKMIVNSIQAQVVMAQSGDIVKTYEVYKQALSDETILNRQSRSAFVQLLMQNPQAMQKISTVKANEIYDFAVKEMEKNLANNPVDSFSHMLMGSLLAQAANVNFQGGDKERANIYLSLAQSEVEKAIESNPGRPSNYFMKAQLALMQGRKEDVVKILEQAVNLNPEFPEATCQLGRTLGFLQPKDRRIIPTIDKCIEIGGTRFLDQATVADTLKRYEKTKNLKGTITIYEYIATVQPKDGRVWAALAEVYRRNGDKDKAINAAEQAAANDPTLKASSEQFINSLK
jgi:O-antigen ligase